MTTPADAIRLAIDTLEAHYDGRFDQLQVGEASKLLEELAQQALSALRAAQEQIPVYRTKARPCAYPGCENLEDPRWGGFCDGHG